jgi:hypothetical protein
MHMNMLTDEAKPRQVGMDAGTAFSPQWQKFLYFLVS